MREFLFFMEVQIGPSGPYSSEPKVPLRGEKSRKKFWIVVGAFLAFVLLILGYIFWQAFDLWLGQRRAKQWADQLRETYEATYQRKLTDTYGGKTPQETLQMYIEAVEKEDYELASRYFIEENRELELESLKGSSKAKLNTHIFLLQDSSKITGGYYPRNDEGGMEFIVDEPIYIRMTLYPNGIWKIIEI